MVSKATVLVETRSIRVVSFATGQEKNVAVELQHVDRVVGTLLVDFRRPIPGKEHEGILDFEVEELQWFLGPRIDRGRTAASRRAYRVVPATSDVEQPTVADHRKAIVLASVAGSAGEQVVLPDKDLLGVEVLELDVFDLVSGRVLAVTPSPCAGTHGRESAATRSTS